MNKILIVDDDPEIHKLLRAKMIQEGYGVMSASDAYGAIQTARREKPDLIILDIMLPGGGGLHALKNIRLLSDTASIPVVILTGSEDAEIKQKIIEHGVQGYLQKPFEYQTVSGKIAELLKSDANNQEEEIAGKSKRKNILVVDDDPDIISQLSRKLAADGYDVIAASDAYHAIQTIIRAKPDLIILDIMLPGGGGLHVLQKIRAIPGTSNMPVIVLTGSEDAGIKQKMIDQNISGYFQKPYDYTVLRNYIKDVFSKR
ncbi:MAG: response regulator [Syntrophorhabdus sp.]